jgi:hypothetical protein
MDTGVCSAGTMEIYFFSGHQREPMLNFPLYGAVMPLALPATENSAIIADKQLNISKTGRHRRKIRSDCSKFKEITEQW